jgi:His-Xaa-Ser system protein HxsD
MAPKFDEIKLELDQAVYSLEAVKNASYDFTDKADILIELLSSTKVCIIMKQKANSKTIGNNSLSSDFIRSVLDHQVRLDTLNNYKHIREMIIAQAFEPVDNLEEVIEVLKI